MFYCNLLICFIFGYCFSENMSNYKLLSNTPMIKHCSDDLENIYRIYEKHPDTKNIAMCCGTRISRYFILTEQNCLKQPDTKYITVHTYTNFTLLVL